MLTAMDGSPSLFVAVNSTRPRGDSPGTFCASSTPPFGDFYSSLASYGLITIPSATCACTIYPCTVYIGVGAPEYAVFAIAATLGVVGSQSGILTLSSGVVLRSESSAVAGALQPNAAGAPRTQLYDFSLIPNAVSPLASAFVTIDLSAFSSDNTATLVLARWTRNVGAFDTATVTNATAQYTTRIVNGAATLSLPHGDRWISDGCGGVTSGIPCKLRIAVISSQTTYTVSARTDGGQLVSDGVPAIAQVTAPGGGPGTTYAVFRYLATHPLSPLIFAVTPFNGPVDIFVSSFAQTTFLPPRAGAAGWSSISSALTLSPSVSAITVAPTDAGSCGAHAPPCSYFVAVRAGAGAPAGTISFSLLARTRASSVTPLAAGRPTNDVLPGGFVDPNIYSFKLSPASQSFTLTLQTTSGAEPSVYLSATAVPGATGVGAVALPFTTTVGQTERSLTLSRSVGAALASCMLYTSQIVTEEVCVDDDGIKSCEPTRGMRQVFSGFAPCNLNIAIYAAAGGLASAYTITASTSSRLLRDGVPILIDIPANTTLYFALEAAGGAVDVTLGFAQLFGRASALVSRSLEFPTSTTADISLGGVGSASLPYYSAQSACAPTQSPRCATFIALTGWDGKAARVRLVASSFTITPIDIGAPPLPGRTALGTPTVYSFVVRAADVAAGSIDVLIESSRGGFVTALVGSTLDVNGVSIAPSLTCTLSGYTPSACPSTAVTLNNVALLVRGSSFRLKFNVAAGNVPTFANGASLTLALITAVPTDFTLALRTRGAPLILLNGFPAHDTLEVAASASFFRLIVPAGSAPAPLRIEGTTVQGYPILYLGVGHASTLSTIRLPGPLASVASSQFVDNYGFIVTVEQLRTFCPRLATEECEVNVGVVPAPVTRFPVVFRLSATLSPASTSAAAPPQDAMLLQPGAPLLASVAAGAWTYFYVSLPAVSVSDSAFVSLQEVVGSAAVFALPGGVFPLNASAPADGTFFSDGAAAPKIIPLRLVNATTLVIGVWGIAPISQFYILAALSSSVTELPDGASIQGAVAPGGIAYYSSSVPFGASDVQVAITVFSGRPQLTGAKWYDGDKPSTAEAAAFRPTRTATSFQSNFEGVLTVPRTSPSACVGVCTYIYAVSCRTTIPCAFEVTVASTSETVTRISEGIPSEAEVLQGRYRYFIYDAGLPSKNITITAQETSGSAIILVTNTWIPGSSLASAFPSIGATTSYFAASRLNEPFVKFFSPAATASSGNTYANSIYVIGVYAMAGPLAVSLVVRPTEGSTVLQPGVGSALVSLAAGSIDYFTFDNQDLTHDLQIVGELTYGAILVAVSTQPGVFPKCRVTRPVGTPASAPGVATCTGASWTTTSSRSQALLRILASAPCSPLKGVATAICFAARDWLPGPINIAVVSLLNARYSIAATTGADPVRAFEGQPLEVFQSADDASTAFMFSTPADSLGSDVRMVLASDTSTAGFTWYMTSCRDDICTDADILPSPSNYKSRGWVRSGERTTVLINPAAGAIYCSGDLLAPGADICNYFAIFVPNSASCESKRLIPCASRASATFSSSAGLAPIRLDYSQLRERWVTLTGSIFTRPDGTVNHAVNYMSYINSWDSPASEVVDIAVRIDSCDQMRGHPILHGCVSDPQGRFPACAPAEGPAAGNSHFSLWTGGGGSARAQLIAEPSNILYTAVSSTYFADVNRTGASPAAFALYGPSTYEMHIVDGAAVRLRAPTDASFLVTRINATAANISWLLPVVSQFAELGAANATAAGITYAVFWAPESYTTYASAVTNVSANDLGIVPSTACGLERWASLVKANYSAPFVASGASPSILLTGLTAGRRYRVSRKRAGGRSARLALGAFGTYLLPPPPLRSISSHTVLRIA